MKYTTEQKTKAYDTCKNRTNFENIENITIAAAIAAMKDYFFYAEMSDDYATTCKEKEAIRKQMAATIEEAEKRHI